MTSIRDILANNLKENRKRRGFSQAKLAEKADISTQYVAMIEVSRKFPTPEMLERLAEALEIEAYELFIVKQSPENAMAQLHDALVNNIERVVKEAVVKALAKKENQAGRYSQVWKVLAKKENRVNRSNQVNETVENALAKKENQTDRSNQVNETVENALAKKENQADRSNQVKKAVEKL